MDETLRADVVIVGARCAGAAAARLLAETGRRVVVLDRSAPGSDTLSTHALMRGGVLQLQRWGLLDAVVAAGTPPIRRTTFHHPDAVFPIEIKPVHGVDALYAPRRTVLDPILVDAAARAGADFRFGTRVTELLRDSRGRVVGVVASRGEQTLEVRGELVVGADGMWSTVARLLRAPIEHQGRHAGGVVYTYFSGLVPDGYEWYYGDRAAAGVIPTNGGDAVVFAATEAGRFKELATDGVEAAFARIIERAAPTLTRRLADGLRTGRWRSAHGLGSYLRRSHGPGWALIGDAGSFKDPIAAHGITDALRDAEQLAAAVTAGGDQADALADFQRRRDELTRPILDLADEISSYRWTTGEVQDLLLGLNRAMNVELEAIAAMGSATVP